MRSCLVLLLNCGVLGVNTVVLRCDSGAQREWDGGRSDSHKDLLTFYKMIPPSLPITGFNRPPVFYGSFPCAEAI